MTGFLLLALGGGGGVGGVGVVSVATATTGFVGIVGFPGVSGSLCGPRASGTVEDGAAEAEAELTSAMLGTGCGLLPLDALGAETPADGTCGA